MAGIDANTKLYLPLNSVTNGATTVNGAYEILDSGNTGLIITQQGDAKLSVAQKKFGSTSLHINDTGDYISATDNTNFNLGTGDWTLEGYYYFITSFYNYRILWAKINSASPYAGWQILLNSDGKVEYRTDNNTVRITSTNAVPADEFVHIAVEKYGTDVTIYINGVANGSYTGSPQNYDTSLFVGQNQASQTFNATMYVDDLRVTKGESIYQGAFTPSSTQLTAGANTKLLLHMDTQDLSGDGGSGTYHIPDFRGTFQLSTGKQFYAGDGTAGLADGNSDDIRIPYNESLNLIASTSGDYTIDFWLAHTDHSGVEYLVNMTKSGVTNTRWGIFHNDANGYAFAAYSAGTPIINTGYGGETTDTNSHHIALVKIGGATPIYAMYKDGAQINYTADASTLALDDFVELCAVNEASYFDGYFGHIRFQASNYFNASPNVGKTDTITVPTAPYSVDTPPSGNTGQIILMCS